MAEKIVSPGVFTRQKDLSFLPQGIGEIGAVVIGPTIKGPAFLPTVVASFADFEIKFGKSIFEISNDTSNKEIIDKSNYLITDFSGIALTFSYRKLLPTIFIIKDQNDNILLHENYYKNTLKNIGIQIKYSKEMIIDTKNHIKKKRIII